MNVVLTAVLAIQMLAAVAMIGLILLQHGKGADMGAAFGSGSSGSANFLSRTTAVLAVVFFACTLMLAYFSHSVKPTGSSSVLERAAVPATSPAAQPASGAAAIPGTSAPAASAVAPAAPASGAAQIPTK